MLLRKKMSVYEHYKMVKIVKRMTRLLPVNFVNAPLHVHAQLTGRLRLSMVKKEVAYWQEGPEDKLGGMLFVEI